MVSKSFVFNFADCEVHEREFRLIKAGQLLTVEPKAFRALLFLLHNPQKLISKDELLTEVWGDATVTDGSLTRCIWLLRGLLGDDIRSPRYIQTVPTVGYRWVCELEVREENSASLEPAKGPVVLNGFDPARTLLNFGVTSPIAEVRLDSVAGQDVRVKDTVRQRGGFWRFLLPTVLVLMVCLGFAILYLHRPLPPLRILKSTQITHDGHKKTLAGTDGRRLFLNSTYQNDVYSGEVWPGGVSQVTTSGEETAQFSVALPSPKLIDVSKDGASLLVISMPEGVKWAHGTKLAYPLWNVQTLGGSARRLGEAIDASFSPDGNSVAYSTQEGDIWLVRKDGTGARKLASVGDYLADIAWSPDGGMIRFTRGGEFWEMSSTGSIPHKLFPSRHASFGDCCGRWTPDGEFFVFMTAPVGFWEGSEIWVRDERHGMFLRPPPEPVQLAAGPIRWGRPIPGKDGKTIFAEGEVPRGELSRFDPHTRQFQPFLGGISAQGAVFSNDDQYVAYVSFPESTLWKANRDGSNPVQLSDSSMWTVLPRWSPDGKQIAFTGLTKTSGERNYVVSATGDSPPKLLLETREAQSFPYWSPDGGKIAFTAWSANGTPDIRILDLTTRQVTTIPGSEGFFAPRWSPDGRYLCTSHDELHLKIFDLKTQQWSELPQKGSVDSWEWSRDGRYIYFRRVKGDLGVFRISVKGGVVEKIVDLKEWRDAGWFAKYMGLDSTDAPLLLRDIGSDDIYALTLAMN